METLDPKEEHQSMDATTLVVDLAKAFKHAQLNVVWQWAMYLDFRQRVLRCCTDILRTRAVCHLRTVFSGPLATVTAILPGSTSSIFVAENCRAGRCERCFHGLP